MTSGPFEPTAALRPLRALVARLRLRVARDGDGWPFIPGRYGQIEFHDGVDLAVYTDRPRLFQKLGAIPGVRRHQTGDREMRALFPPEALQQVAAVIRAQTRRTLSSEEARRRSGLPATPRATSARQDRVPSDGPGRETRAGMGP